MDEGTLAFHIYLFVLYTCLFNVVLHYTYLMQGHPNAQGMRNNSFPHFNDLAIIFGRDQTIGIGVETPVDAIEELEMEEQQHLHTLPAINIES